MAYSTTRSTFFCPAGTKWYWEFVPTTNYNYASCGITTNSAGWAVNPGGTTDGHGVGFYDVEIDIDGTRTTPSGPASTAWASGDIIGFAYDVDANTIKKYINGSLDYTFTSVPVSTDGPYSPTFGDFGGSVAATINVNFGADSSFGGLKTAQGNQDSNEIGDFYYTPPTDYLALCTDNLSDPEIALPGENFNTVLYTGDGATSKAMTGVGFQPDFTWIKNRSSAYDHMLQDAVRGVGVSGTPKNLASNLTSAQPSGHNGHVSVFGSDGFTVADGSSGGAPRVSVNTSGDNYASWNWKAGGAPTATNSAGAGATPTAGSVKIDGSNLGSALGGTVAATKLSANTTSGFSIVQWTGTETSISLAHGLAEPPELIIVKSSGCSGCSWRIGQSVITGQKFDTDDGWYMEFTTAANHEETSPIIWGDPATTPSSSLFYIGSNGSMNSSGDGMIAYCFHSVEGYSKVGSYTGNNNADGAFIYTGMRPAFIMAKRTSATEDWVIMDNKRNTYNWVGARLYPDLNNAEGSSETIDFVSNGFKMRSTNSITNAASTYVYLAFAESPFKTSNAR